jgi:organic radical activating enzyme
MINAIEDKAGKFNIIWDMGRRCTYACTYCPPNRRNKTSTLFKLKDLTEHFKKVHEYVQLLANLRAKPVIHGITFTGGEPTVHPDFFKFLGWIKENYPEYKLALTTNGAFGPGYTKQCKELLSTGTISYHPEGTDKQKKLVLDNIFDLCLTTNFTVNVMFHKDYFDECVDLCDKLKDHKIQYVPRLIGDAQDDEYGVRMGYAHVYTEEQLDWFKRFWKPKKAPKLKTQKDLGRPCCGSRNFKTWDEDGNTETTKFLPDTNFFGWNCMVNWYFLYIHQELDLVWTHQTCGVKPGTNKPEPLSKLSEFDKYIDEISKDIYENNTMPMIKCPKKFCGCGMCITKAKDDIPSIELFKVHSPTLTPKLSIDVEYVPEHKELTTSRIFKNRENRN